MLTLEQQHRHARHIQRQKVRHQPHHRLVAALGQAHITLHMDQALEPLGWRIPQQAAFQQTAGQPAEVLAHQGAAGLGVQLRQAQFHIAQRDAPARAGQPVQQRAQALPQCSLQTQRQVLKGPQEPQHATSPQLAHHGAASSPGGRWARRGCL